MEAKTPEGITYKYYKCENCGEEILNMEQLHEISLKKTGIINMTNTGTNIENRIETKTLFLLLTESLALAHEEENPPILQGFVHWLGLSEELFIFGLTAIVLVAYLLWKS